MNLFQLGDFKLSSGIKSKYKIEADALSDLDIKTLAEMICQLVGPFSSVKGIPRGGLRLEEALRPHQAGRGYPHLITDDVLTSGKSMDKARISYSDDIFDKDVVGAVIFSRGPCPYWIKAIFTIAPKFWMVNQD